MKSVNVNEMRNIKGGFWVTVAVATMLAEAWLCGSVGFLATR